MLTYRVNRLLKFVIAMAALILVIWIVDSRPWQHDVFLSTVPDAFGNKRTYVREIAVLILEQFGTPSYLFRERSIQSFLIDSLWTNPLRSGRQQLPPWVT